MDRLPRRRDWRLTENHGAARSRSLSDAGWVIARAPFEERLNLTTVHHGCAAPVTRTE
jgi:hypothetical protein